MNAKIRIVLLSVMILLIIGFCAVKLKADNKAAYDAGSPNDVAEADTVSDEPDDGADVINDGAVDLSDASQEDSYNGLPVYRDMISYIYSTKKQS